MSAELLLDQHQIFTWRGRNGSLVFWTAREGSGEPRERTLQSRNQGYRRDHFPYLVVQERQTMDLNYGKCLTICDERWRQLKLNILTARLRHCYDFGIRREVIVVVLFCAKRYGGQLVQLVHHVFIEVLS